MKKTVWHIGIDPGVFGAMAVISDLSMEVFDFDDSKGLAFLRSIADGYHRGEYDVQVMIEKVSSMSGQGVSSTFKFGANFGQWIGRLEVLAIPYDLVTPGKWKKVMFDSAAKDENKKEFSRQRAIRVFPNMVGRLSKKKDHNRAEALLIAEYSRRIYK